MCGLIRWFKRDPFGAMAAICLCLLMGSCTVHSIAEDWGLVKPTTVNQ